METLKAAGDSLFILLGAIMVLAMHAGFAFLELGTVRKKNQVNALIKVMVDFAVSTIAYFFIGYALAYGVTFFTSAESLAARNGYELVKFFFLLTFAGAIPAIVSGGIAERAKFNPQLAATFLLVGFLYPFFEGIAWNQHYGIQGWLKSTFGEEFHDFAGSVVVHAFGGWVALVAVLLLGARRGRYSKEGRVAAHPDHQRHHVVGEPRLGGVDVHRVRFAQRQRQLLHVADDADDGERPGRPDAQPLPDGVLAAEPAVGQ